MILLNNLIILLRFYSIWKDLLSPFSQTNQLAPGNSGTFPDIHLKNQTQTVLAYMLCKGQIIKLNHGKYSQILVC